MSAVVNSTVVVQLVSFVFRCKFPDVSFGHTAVSNIIVFHGRRHALPEDGNRYLRGLRESPVYTPAAGIPESSVSAYQIISSFNYVSVLSMLQSRML